MLTVNKHQELNKLIVFITYFEEYKLFQTTFKPFIVNSQPLVQPQNAPYKLNQFRTLYCISVQNTKYAIWLEAVCNIVQLGASMYKFCTLHHYYYICNIPVIFNNIY